MWIALVFAFTLLIAAPVEAFHGSSHILPRRRHLPLGDGSGTLKVRLAEIDAPEIDHPYGTQARDTLYAIICGRVVDVEPRGTSYDRLVGLIRVRGLDTSESMVRAGAAWDYPRYGTDPAIHALEARARAGRLGSWAAARPVAPWDWWRGCRDCDDDALVTDQLIAVRLDPARARRQEVPPLMRKDF